MNLLTPLRKLFSLNPPATGEQTKRQPRGQAAWGLSAYAAPYEVPAGTYQTYRRMQSNPTIAIAMATALAPVRASSWSFTATDDSVPEDAVTLVQDVLLPARAQLIKDLLRAVAQGWQALELVWGVRNGQYVIERFKPLLPDVTKIRTDEQGNFAGLTNQGVDLEPDQCILWTYDGEAGNLYGRSRHENIREYAWAPWNDANEQLRKYGVKISGIIPVLTYPLGQEQDGTGATVDNFDIARGILETLPKGVGVAMPATIAPWAEERLRRGEDVSDLMAWKLTTLDFRSGGGAEFRDTLRYYDSLMMRGWLVPERVALEGQHGTLAEADAHGDIALSIAEEVSHDLIGVINRQVVGPLLVANYGEQARGWVTLEASAITGDDRAFIKRVVEALIVNPANFDVAMEALDFDAMLDAVGLPKSSEVVDVSGLAETPDDEDGAGRAAGEPLPTESLSSLALNGAQVTAIKELQADVAAGRIPLANAVELAAAAYPSIPLETIRRIFKGLDTFKPATEESAASA